MFLNGRKTECIRHNSHLSRLKIVNSCSAVPFKGQCKTGEFHLISELLHHMHSYLKNVCFGYGLKSYFSKPSNKQIVLLVTTRNFSTTNVSTTSDYYRRFYKKGDLSINIL